MKTLTPLEARSCIQASRSSADGKLLSRISTSRFSSPQFSDRIFKSRCVTFASPAPVYSLYTNTFLSSDISPATSSQSLFSLLSSLPSETRYARSGMSATTLPSTGDRISALP